MPRTAQQNGSTHGESFFAHLSEFLSQGQFDPNHTIDINRLPEDITATIRPLLPAGARHITEQELLVRYAQAIRLLGERERYLRAETLMLDWQNEHTLARSRASYLATLSERERAALLLHLQAQADADARAARDCERMADEIVALRRELREARDQLALATFGVRPQ